MRLDFLQVGDNFGFDEYNAFVHILLSKKYQITENIQLNPEGYTGKFADYYLEYNPANVAFRGDDIQVLNDEATLKITCVSDLTCRFALTFQGETFYSNEGIIIVDLFEVATDEIINNSFTVEIFYDTPYIEDKITGDAIATTSDLREAIDTIEEGETLTLASTVIHDITESIMIKSSVTIQGATEGSTISSDGTHRNPLFVVDNNAELRISDVEFHNFTNNNNPVGAVIYNRGILNIVDSKFYKCNAAYDGACIYNEYGDVFSDTVTYEECSARNGAGIFNKGD